MDWFQSNFWYFLESMVFILASLWFSSGLNLNIYVRETAMPAINCRIILGCPLSFILSPVVCTFRMHPQHVHPSPVLPPTFGSKPLSSLLWVNWSSYCSFYPQQSLFLTATRRIFKIIQVRSGHYPPKTFQLLPFEFEIRLEFLTQPARHQWASVSSAPPDITLLGTACPFVAWVSFLQLIFPQGLGICCTSAWAIFLTSFCNSCSFSTNAPTFHRPFLIIFFKICLS